MATHQSNPSARRDDYFVKGELRHLVVGNECRLLDRRRTPGKITDIDLEGGFFRWQILDFEDRGRFWDVPFERVSSYQFEMGSEELPLSQQKYFLTIVHNVQDFISIEKEHKIFLETQNRISEVESLAFDWLSNKSEFFSSTHTISFQDKFGPKKLAQDFRSYMAEHELLELESVIASYQVMNPESGDWVKATQIVMAELGLKPYKGFNVRSEKIFSGIGTKKERERHVFFRMAFLRALFRKLGINEVVLYRGMSSEFDWMSGSQSQNRFWSSWTFNFQVAMDFSDLEPDNVYKNSYMIKRSIPVDQLFMTYLETEEMNAQYLEAEALVLHLKQDQLLW